jgi:NADH-quinone oxidoreductase subunit H
VALVTVIRNTNPRLRIDQAMRFFWGTLTGLAVIALLLAFMGK